MRDLAAYESRKYDTAVLVPSVAGGAAREQTHGLSVRRFRYFPRRWEDLADGAILENLRARPSRWLQVGPFFIAEVWALRRLVREVDPDVLHVHWLIPQGVAALAGARGRPMLVTTLGGDLYGLRDPLSKRLITAVLRRAGAVTAMNEDMRERLIQLGARPDQVTVLPMGADVDGIRELASGIEPVGGRILFVGRLVEKKGAAVLLAALRVLADQNYNLRVVGDGPLRQGVAGPGRGVAGDVPGRVAPRRARARVRRRVSHRVPRPCEPRAGPGWFAGVALLEAMAAGRPVIASALPGLAEAVEDGTSGRVVPSGDPEALASAIRSVLSDPAEALRLGRGANARADAYSVRSMGEQYIAILDRLRAEASSGASAAGADGR